MRYKWLSVILILFLIFLGLIFFFKKNSKLKITYWIDYACPYSYIAQKRLEKALLDLNYDLDKIQIEVKAFELDKDASYDVVSSTDVRFAKKYGLSLIDAQKRIDEISALGKNEGIDFNYINTNYTNTLDAHRLTKLVQSKGDNKKTNETVNLLFDAYFVKNQKLSDKSLLKNLAQNVGVSEVEINELFNSDDFIKDVRYDENEADDLNIHGVPYFIINNKEKISGAQTTEEMKQTILKVAKQNSKKEVKMKIEQIPVTDVFTTNSYFYIDENTSCGFLIDPGAQAEKLISIIQKNNWKIEAILLTHGHFDHICAVEKISK